MANIRKDRNAWRAEIRVNGKRKSKSFKTKAQARAWINDIEQNGIGADMLVSALLDRYLEEVSENKKGHQWEKVRINAIKGMDIAAIRLDRLDSNDVSQWKKARLNTVSGSTVNREWNLLSAIFSQAVEWKLLTKNPMSEVKRPKSNPARTRVYTPDEIERVLLCSQGNIIGSMFEFAIETAIRTGEMCKSEWVNVHENYIHLPGGITKNGFPRDVPLSSRAKGILNSMQKVNNFIFGGIKPASVDTRFRRIRDKALIEGATFHDSRATALTRLSKIYDVMELARISGHRDLRMLLNVYYRPSIDDLAKKLK